MRILVTGATGFVGRHIVQALVADKHDLVLTSRAAHNEKQGCTWRVIDFATALDPEDWEEVLKNVELVINAVGIFKPTRTQSFAALHDEAPRALFEACKRAGVRRVIQISALGADEKAGSEYHLSKRRADDALAGSGLEWVVLRPSLIIGGEGESWRFFKALACLPVTPVIGDGAQPLQPVAICDVVKAVRASIHKAQAAGRRIDIVGADNLTQESYLQALASWLGRKNFRAVKLSYRLAGAFAAGGWLFADMPLNRQAVSMLKEARPGDLEACRSGLGFSPEGLGNFLSQNPASKQDKSAASLYFLGPALRLSLAFLWVMAGVVTLFFYPHMQSLALLARLGFAGIMGEIALYGAAMLDILIGLSLLMRFYLKPMAVLQICLIVIYTLALSWVAPSMWFDPFGPLAKNIPIIVAILIMSKLEE